MYKLCKTEQSAKRQREIELTLLSLMQTKRFEDVSVSEICAAMNMPRKAFYRYFDSRDGALNALIDHTLHLFPEYSLSATVNEHRSLTRELESYFIFWKKNRALLDALERSNLTGLLIQASISDAVSDMVDLGKFLPEDSDWMRSQVFYFTVCGLTSLMLSWYRSGFGSSTEEMARAACRMFSRPLFPNLDKLGINE